MTTQGNRRFLAPEVVQTSAMDCGPAALKSLLEGFGIVTSYGRLREACQTDVDGSSIDTLEDIANRVGLSVEQTLLPVDHLLLRAMAALPSIVVVKRGNAGTHFVVLWRKIGPWVQIMDPAIGRRWLGAREFLRDVYVHSMSVPAAAVLEWFGSDQALAAFRERFARLGTGSTLVPLLDDTRRAGDIRRFAALDATLRMASELVRSRSLSRGADVARFVAHTVERLRREEQAVPARFWTMCPAPPGPEGGPCASLTGAVLLKTNGRASAEAVSDAPPLPPEIEAAVRERPARPARALWQALRRERALSVAALLVASLVVAAGAALEIVLLRALFNIGAELPIVQQRLFGFAAIACVSLALLGLELPLASGSLRLGRALETRLRIAFFEKLPRLGDRYLQSRPASDMAERSHSLHSLRHLPELCFQFLRILFDIGATVAGLVWLDPAGAPATLACLLATLVASVVLHERIAERDLRFRSLSGGLTRFYLDALLGLLPVKSHTAENAIQHEHGLELAAWWQSGLALTRVTVAAEGLGFAIGSGAAGLLLALALGRQPDGRTLLLLVYWILSLPALAHELCGFARRFPLHRSLTLRLLEPMGALEETPATLTEQRPPGATAPGVAIELSGVGVRAGGHPVLHDVDCVIPAGQHVAIVGASGAGKSSLVGLLLGFHRASAGTLLVDGEPLAAARLAHVRRESAWLDPQVQLWNRSLFDNLIYGSLPERNRRLDEAVRAADLSPVLQGLPDGMQSPLGECGGLLSGGEGQRVRFARALLRPDARLVVMDEPFRGLDRALRETLLVRARGFWKDATLLAVTHDVEHALYFDRVLVVDAGTIVEDGRPSALAADASSRYRALIDAERALARELRSSGLRAVRLERGRVVTEQS